MVQWALCVPSKRLTMVVGGLPSNRSTITVGVGGSIALLSIAPNGLWPMTIGASCKTPMFDIGDLVWAGAGYIVYLVIDKQDYGTNDEGEKVCWYKLMNVREDRNIKRDERYLQRCQWERYEYK